MIGQNLNPFHVPRIWRTIAVMDRRRLLLGLAGGAAALISRASAQDGLAMARLAVDYEHPGRAIARDFVGLSYESAVVAANDFFTADNRTLLRLLRTLGAEGVSILVAAGGAGTRTVMRVESDAVPPGPVAVAV